MKIKAHQPDFGFRDEPFALVSETAPDTARSTQERMEAERRAEIFAAAQPVLVHAGTNRPALAVAVFPGPFPRKRHAHRCRRCGQGRSTACYKAHCLKLRDVDTCQYCRH